MTQQNAAHKAWVARRTNMRIQAAQRTDKWTEILCRALTARAAKRWRLVSFRGRNGGEWKGIVDLLAIRKNTHSVGRGHFRAGDLFDIILIQAKGGTSARPTPRDIARLQAVQHHYSAKEVVLFTWKKGEVCSFERLVRGMWEISSAKELFG